MTPVLGFLHRTRSTSPRRRRRVIALLIAVALLAPGSPDASAQQSCDDGNPCTVDDTLIDGICVGTPRNCDDATPCTDDACDVVAGCVHAFASAPCTDGNACTSNDTCVEGTCVGGNSEPGCAACEAIAALPADGGTFIGATAGTGSLAGTCGSTAASPERVYAWTPRASGSATIATCGGETAYDSVVYVRGAGCTGTELQCNDDTQGCPTSEPSTYHGSRVTIAVTAGQTYFIVVDGYDGRAGRYTLTVTAPSVCGNGVREGAEDCDGSDDASCVSGQCGPSCLCVPPPGGLPDLVPVISEVTTAFGASVSGGDVAEGCAEATSGVDLIRFSVTSSNVGTADLILGDPGCPLPCDAHPLEVCANPEFVCSPADGHNHPHYSNYARYELLDTAGTAVVIGHKQGFCLRDTGCAAPRYTCTDQGISAGCADTYGWQLGCQYLDVTDVPDGSYRLRVTLDPFDQLAELSDGNNVTEQTLTLQRPSTTTPTATSQGTATPTPARTPTRTATPTGGAPSPTPGGPTATPLSASPTPGPTATAAGSCAAPIVVPASGGTFTGTTAGTGALQGSCGSTGPSPEMIFQWTPAVSGQASIQTCSGTATSYDTVLYVRSGSCAAGAQVGCNDDTTGCSTSEPSNHHGSRVTPLVTAGQTYFVVVDGYNGARGSFTLTIVPPSGPTATTTATPATTPTAGGATATRTATPAATRSATPSATFTGPAATSSPTPSGTPSSGTCTAPIVVPPSGGSLSGRTAGTSALAGTCATSGNSPEVVYSWTPARSGTATIATCGGATSFDTVAYVRASSCTTGAQVACNDDTTGCSTSEPSDHHGSRLGLTVTAGQTYFIVVDGYDGRAGDFTLTVTAP